MCVFSSPAVPAKSDDNNAKVGGIATMMEKLDSLIESVSPKIDGMVVMETVQLLVKMRCTFDRLHPYLIHPRIPLQTRYALCEIASQHYHEPAAVTKIQAALFAVLDEVISRGTYIHIHIYTHPHAPKHLSKQHGHHNR